MRVSLSLLSLYEVISGYLRDTEPIVVPARVLRNEAYIDLLNLTFIFPMTDREIRLLGSGGEERDRDRGEKVKDVYLRGRIPFSRIF